MTKQDQRPLTKLEAATLQFIKDNPGLTPEDISSLMNEPAGIYEAIYHLVLAMHVKIDLTNSAITAYEEAK